MKQIALMGLMAAVLAVGLIKALAWLDLPRDVRQGWWVVSAGLAMRYAGVAVILGAGTRLLCLS
jgi:hypothetical protein